MNTLPGLCAPPVSASADYFTRTLAFPGGNGLDAAASLLPACRPALNNLCNGYKKLGRYTDRMDYSAATTQLSYALHYLPHHAAQLRGAVLRCEKLAARCTTAQPMSLVSLAAGPGTELLGTSFALSSLLRRSGPAAITACLIDKSEHCWGYGRAIVRYHLQHPEHRAVANWGNVAHEGWNMTLERMPDRVADYVGNADLITCMNVLTEIVAAGPYGCAQFTRNVTTVLEKMKPGASFVFTDLGAYKDSLQILRDVSAIARRMSFTVNDVQIKTESSPFDIVRDSPLMENFYSTCVSPRKQLCTASLVMTRD